MKEFEIYIVKKMGEIIDDEEHALEESLRGTIYVGSPFLTSVSLLSQKHSIFTHSSLIHKLINTYGSMINRN